MKFRLTLIVLAWSLFSGNSAYAIQGTPSPPQQDSGKSVDEIITELQKDLSVQPGSLGVVPPPQLEEQSLLQDDTTRIAYLNAWRAYFSYRTFGYEHRKEVFRWQIFSSRVIFWAVHFLVLTGIVFSGIQFFKSVGRQDESGSPEDTRTEIEATREGIKVSSPVLGVIILVLSLAFFYLYLAYVYPIHEKF